MQTHTIGQLARRAEVNVETVRFYERRGLIPEPPRTPSGYRRYPETAVARIRFIQRAKELGFSLSEVRDLLTLRVGADATCGEVRLRAEAKAAEIDRKIRDLQAMRLALDGLIAACAGDGPTSECPILDRLSGGSVGGDGGRRSGREALA